MGNSHLLEVEKILSNKIKRLKNLIQQTEKEEREHFETALNESIEAINNKRNSKIKYKRRVKNILFSSVGLVLSLGILIAGSVVGLSTITILGTAFIGASCFVIGYNKPSSFRKYNETKKRLELLETSNKYQVYVKSERLQAMERSLVKKQEEHKKLMQKIHNLVNNKNKVETKVNINQISNEESLEK